MNVGKWPITSGPSGLMAACETRTRTSLGLRRVGVGRVVGERIDRGVPRVLYVQARIVLGMSKLGVWEEDIVGGIALVRVNQARRGLCAIEGKRERIALILSCYEASEFCV